MTLGRFVRSYVLQPLAAPLARWSARQNHNRRVGHYYSVLLPTFIAMLVIGVWHGAGWNFVLFGALHGIYMAINEAWTFRRRQRKAKPLPVWLTTIVDRGGGHALTVVAFVVAAVPFRAANGAATGNVYSGMFGLGGVDNIIPSAWPLGAAGILATLVVGYLIVFLAPNTQQIMQRTEPALDWPQWNEIDQPAIRAIWRPTALWTAIGGAVLCVGIAFILRGSTEFIYFNF
jgi:D-alanyl-lipoteichoic acid acyltransferase DltB (MBOAT superfamily)